MVKYFKENVRIGTDEAQHSLCVRQNYKKLLIRRTVSITQTTMPETKLFKYSSVEENTRNQGPGAKPHLYPEAVNHLPGDPSLL